MKTPIEQAYLLESLLRVLSLATDGDRAGTITFEFCDGGSVLVMAADMAGQIVNDLAKPEMAIKDQSPQP